MRSTRLRVGDIPLYLAGALAYGLSRVARGRTAGRHGVQPVARPLAPLPAPIERAGAPAPSVTRTETRHLPV